MEDIPIGDNVYRVGTISAMQQFHVMRRLAPVLGGFAEVVRSALKSGKTGVELLSALKEGQVDISTVIEPMLKAISEMSDADSEYVINTCLNVCARRIEGGKGWAPVRSSGQLMFNDIKLTAMAQLVWKVLEANLGDFFVTPSQS